MKKLVVMALLAVMALGILPANAFAANQNYTMTLPRLGVKTYSSIKTVAAKKDFGTKLKYAGGKTVNMQVCDSSRNPMGSSVSVRPGGSAAGLVDLWYNSASSQKAVVVKVWSSLTTVVQVLAEGTWYWNY